MLASFNERAASWDSAPRRQALLLDNAQAIRSSVPLTKEWKVLDYGCGTGGLSFALLPYVAEITAADASSGMVAEATRKKIALADHKESARLSTIQLDLVESPPLNLKFDLIIACLVMHHIEHADQVLGAFRSMLAPNGWIAIVEWGKPAANPTLAIKNRTSEEWAYALAREFVPGRIQCRAVHQFTRDDGAIAPALLITAGPVPPQ